MTILPAIGKGLANSMTSAPKRKADEQASSIRFLRPIDSGRSPAVTSFGQRLFRDSFPGEYSFHRFAGFTHSRGLFLSLVESRLNSEFATW